MTTMDDRNYFVGMGGVLRTLSPSQMPTTASRSEFQTIPLKFTLMGLQNEIPRINDFRKAAMGHMKSTLALVSNDLEGLKITDVKERFIDTVVNDRRNLSADKNIFGRQLEEENSRIFNLYYDVETIVSDPKIFYGPLLIDAVRLRHTEILQQIQEYKPTQYYYSEDLDLCTTTSGRKVYNDELFDVCTQDHQMVSIKFGVTGLPEDVDREMFKNELIDIYIDLLKNVDGLQVTGMYDKNIEELGTALDFYFDINVIQKDRDVELVIENELDNHDARMQLLNRIQTYTDEEGRDIEWCINEAGRYSAEPCILTEASYQMPLWLVCTISGFALVVLGLLVWMLVICCLRGREEDEFKSHVRKYVDDPKDFYRKRSTRRTERPRRHRGDYRRVHDRPHRRQDRRRRENRVRRPQGRRHQSNRVRRQRRHQYDSDDSDTVDTDADLSNERRIILYDNQNRRGEIMQHPPAQQQLLRIEDQYPPRLSQKPDLLRIEAEHPVHPRYPHELMQNPPAQQQLRRMETQNRPWPPRQPDLLRIEAQHPVHPRYPQLPPPGQPKPQLRRNQLQQPPARIPPQTRQYREQRQQFPLNQRDLHQIQPQYRFRHPQQHPPQHNIYHPQQQLRPPQRQQGIRRMDQGPLYCDDGIVNRRDHPQFNHRRQ